MVCVLTGDTLPASRAGVSCWPGGRRGRPGTILPPLLYSQASAGSTCIRLLDRGWIQGSSGYGERVEAKGRIQELKKKEKKGDIFFFLLSFPYT